MRWLLLTFERCGWFGRVLASASQTRLLRNRFKFDPREFFFGALLVSPLVVTGIWLLATGRVFNVFWADDETRYHYELIKEFAREWPRFNFVYAQAATTPLLHILGATLVRFLGANLETLRLCMTLVSALGVLCVFRFLRNERGLSRPGAGLAAAALMLSFYFFGYSFRVLTDNLAVFFCLLAMIELSRFLGSPVEDMGVYLAGCFWLALAALSRQSCVYLCLPFVVGLLLKAKLRPGLRLAGLLALGVMLLPLGVLFILWKGFVPPFEQARHTPGTVPIYVHSIAMPVFILGFYTLFFRGGEIWAWAKGGWRESSARELGTIIAVVALCSGCSVFLLGNNRIYSGLLNTVACQFPSMFGITVLTWLLLLIGLSATLLGLLRHDWRHGDAGKTVGLLSFAAICLVSASNNVAAQKYYDAQVLACMIWQVTPQQADDPRWRRSMCLLVGLFCIYQVVRQSSLAYVAS